MRSATARLANTRANARRRRLIAAGQWNPYMDAEPVREHLRKINATGMPFRAVSERLGLPAYSSLQHLMWGRGAPDPGRRVQRETAELILSYWPSLEDYPDGALIDATGSRRRVQALAVQGWSRMWVAREIGMREDHFRKAIKRDRIQARLVRQIGAVYDAWWDRDPLACGVSANVVARVRAAAAREGWSGPLAWDDDTIDDPAAVPQTDAVPPAVTEGPNVAARWLMGESVVLDAEAHDEVLAYLFEWTTGTKTEIAARLGMTPEAAERKWHRLQQRARKDGRRLWRRVYVPGENPESKSLKRDRMGDAA